VESTRVQFASCSSVQAEFHHLLSTWSQSGLELLAGAGTGELGPAWDSRQPAEVRSSVCYQAGNDYFLSLFFFSFFKKNEDLIGHHIKFFPQEKRGEKIPE
jgi:hypothetical protein